MDIVSQAERVAIAADYLDIYEGQTEAACRALSDRTLEVFAKRIVVAAFAELGLDADALRARLPEDLVVLVVQTAVATTYAFCSQYVDEAQAFFVAMAEGKNFQQCTTIAAVRAYRESVLNLHWNRREVGAEIAALVAIDSSVGGGTS